MRVKSDRIRARYVIGAASDASLLMATLVVRDGRTHLVGEMRWAALYASYAIKQIAPTLVGIAFLALFIDDRNWIATACAAVFVACGAWMSWLSLTSVEEDQQLEQGLLEDELRRLFS